MDIKVRYSTVDRFSKSRRFKTLDGARKFAQKYVGKHPDTSERFGYAVSDDGIGKIEVSGCSINDLFPREATEEEQYLEAMRDEWDSQHREQIEAWAEDPFKYREF
jgi:hypothetical protein